MYSGTLIDDLIEAVERAERTAKNSLPEDAAFLYAVPTNEVAHYESIAGAA